MMRVRSIFAAMLRRAVRYGAAALFFALIASALLWLRSLRALDQLDGRIRFTNFTFTSYAGRLEVAFSRAYYLPMDVVTEGTPTFGQLRIDPNWGGGDYASRSRWPIAITSKAAARSVWFPRPEFDSGIARDGRRRYRGAVRAVVPYWLAMPLFAVVPAVAIPTFVRQRRRERTPFACANCGYDCRASPDRCPECGFDRVDVRERS